MAHQSSDATKEASKRCPSCGSEEVERVSFTFWGGRLGPRLFHLHRCKTCSHQYNAKTMRSIKPFLRRIYFLVFAIILAAIAIMLLTTAM